MDDTTFLATWDDTSNVGIINLTKAELKEFTTSTGPDKGEHITSTLKILSFSLVSFVRWIVRIHTRNTVGNGRPNVQIETEV